MELSIIISTYKRGQIFYQCLNSVVNSISNIDAEIIVINDSKDSDVDVSGNSLKHIITVYNNPKSGVASARNLGAKKAKYENLLFLDDDILISQSNIASLITINDQYQKSAINFNWIYPENLTAKIKKSQFGRYLIRNGYTSLKGWNNNSRWDDYKAFEIELIASYFLFIRKTDFNLIGTYNESFPHAGAEDFEFATRLKKAGIKGLCFPLSIVLHNEEDRVSILPWLQRKERSAETRKIAVNLGHHQMAINTSELKIQLIMFSYFLKPVFFLILKIIPNKKTFDFLYFKLVTVLLSSYLYKGYFKQQPNPHLNKTFV